MEETLADDLLRGVPAIARFLGKTDRALYHDLEAGRLPAAKEGCLWIASKSALRQHYERLLKADR